MKNDSTISIQNTIFETPTKYVGDKINVRYAPTNMDKIYIFSEDNNILDTIYSLKKIDNAI